MYLGTIVCFVLAAFRLKDGGRGGKLNVHLVLDLQDKLVKTMGMAGQSALRSNFTYVVEIRRVGSQRTAHLTTHDSGEARTLSVPTLPDLDALVAAACGEAG